MRFKKMVEDKLYDLQNLFETIHVFRYIQLFLPTFIFFPSAIVGVFIIIYDINCRSFFYSLQWPFNKKGEIIMTRHFVAILPVDMCFPFVVCMLFFLLSRFTAVQLNSRARRGEVMASIFAFLFMFA